MFRPAWLAVLALTLAATSARAADGMGFSVEVSLSPKAAGLLAAKHEKITVAGEWYGDPSPAGKRHVDEMGRIGLGREEVVISGAGGQAAISGRKVKPAELAWVENRNVQVLVNVYSARLSSQDNLLDCGIFEDALTLAQKAPVAIACKVIGEN